MSGQTQHSSAGIVVHDRGPWRFITLSRPEKRNAMTLAMVEALLDAVTEVGEDHTVRAIVLRGAQGHFCAGGDIADMQQAAVAGVDADGVDAIARLNRRFGTLLEAVDHCPAAVIAVCEGAVMGGGFGLAAVADVTLSVEGARFRLPEVTLGITPAQIAPFLVRRLGLAQARRLAVTAATLDAAGAVAVGLAHEVVAPDAVDSRVEGILSQVGRCEPGALAATKALMLRAAAGESRSVLLDDAAAGFAVLARGERAQAGMLARLTRSSPPWEVS